MSVLVFVMAAILSLLKKQSMVFIGASAYSPIGQKTAISLAPILRSPLSFIHKASLKNILLVDTVDPNRRCVCAWLAYHLSWAE